MDSRVTSTLYSLFSLVGFGNDQDIEMETDQPVQPAEGDAENADDDQPPSPAQDPTPNVSGEEKGEGNTTASAAAARKVTLSYEKYRRIANTLILFMRQEEDKITSSKPSFRIFIILKLLNDNLNFIWHFLLYSV